MTMAPSPHRPSRQDGPRRARAEANAPPTPAAPPPATPSASGLFGVATLLGAAGVVGGATALTPLVAGTSWLSPIITVVTVIWIVGLGARALALPAWLVQLLQLGSYCIALTATFTTTGIAGLLPGRAALDEGATMLGTGWHQVMVSEPPAPATIELTLLITIAIGAVALVVDMLIALARTPALAALPLLGLYAVPASIAPGLLPWYAFAGPAICYAAVMAASKPRPMRWHGRSIVNLAVSTAIISLIAIGGSLIATTAATGIGTEGRIPHEGGSSGTVRINPWAKLHGDLVRGQSKDALQVSGLDSPAYLRTFALNKWVDGRGFGPGDIQADSTLTPGGRLAAAPRGSRLATAMITPQQYRDRYLPIYLDTVAVSEIDGGWRYDQSQQTVFRATSTTPGPYLVTTALGALPASQLRLDTVQSGGPLTDTGNLPQQVVQLAESLTADATTPFDRAAALLRYFTTPANGFTYSLHVPVGSSGSALVDFLSAKQGYCEQYAAAMAIMARAVGLPARVGVGFTQGTLLPDGSRQITSADAHAWVEIRFDRAGWVVFDPTPPHDGQGGIQGFIPDATNPGDDGTPGEAETADPGSPSTAPSQSGQATDPVPTPTEQLGAAPQGSDQAPGDQQGTPSWQWWVFAPAGFAVIVALLLLPTAIRRQRRRRRTALVHAGEAGAASAAWDEIADTLIDRRLGQPRAESARSVTSALADRAELSSEEQDRLNAVVSAAEREWYSADRVVDTEPDDRLAAGLTVGLAAAQAAAAPMRWWDRIWPRSLGSARRHR